jgi:prepilin-type N-terminal cleavage/methylation domain-containing protein
MSGTSKGFTFIELTVVILIIGIGATVAIPSFLRKQTAVWDDFTTELNSLVQTGSFDAMSDGKLRRVLFDLEKDQVALQVTNKPNPDSQDPNTPFVTEQSALTKTVITWPVALKWTRFRVAQPKKFGF